MSARERPFHVALGRRLEHLRQRLQFTPRELAERIDISPQALRSYELGIRRVPVALLPVFARVLRVTMDVLLGVTSPPRLRASYVSPAQRRHVDELRKLPRRDRLAVARITWALARAGRST